ncbi:hypothetical protein O9G_000470 [Rozella allomycis CSF55]|uniref:Phorbol-ester/DAG-type domain-containing protein n=1 Tax=Rozella allomycis (strain CSF55) TaxID=988480 RepID=A0A075AYS9_ROZAC|nr:hypothetical protein O9G_000470 [Rozella allomycis CSF55]|eukprot:EPZ33694.1 hypothetical protein O9G_000470 [Rozella allomycis CSF55]
MIIINNFPSSHLLFIFDIRITKLSDYDSRINELEKKVGHELKIKETAETIIDRYESKEAKAQAKLSLSESNKRIEFLKGEILKLKNLKRSDGQIQNNLGAKMTDLDLCRVSVGLTTEKIATKVADLQYKIEIEKRVKAGFDKVEIAYKQSPDIIDKKAINDTKQNIERSKMKLMILKNSLNRYQSLQIEGVKIENHLEEEELSYTQRSVVTGKLRLKLLDVTNLTIKKNKNEGYIEVFVDGISKYKTKNRPKYLFNDEFTLYLEKAAEIEITIFDKNDSMVATMFFRASSLVSNTEVASGLQDNFELEPSGNLNLYLQFDKQLPVKKTFSKIGRRQVIKKKYHIVFGHRFTASKFYSVTRCAFCTELMTGGYQCQGNELFCSQSDCKYACHRKCHEKVSFKCISQSKIDLTPDDPRLRIKYKIPHRFDSHVLAIPSFCCHCGIFLTPGRKIRKCTEVIKNVRLLAILIV